MSIEIHRDALLIRSWHESDADALATAVSANLEHIRPWLPWARELPDDQSGVRAAMGTWVADAVGKPDHLVGLFVGDAVAGGAGFHDRIGPGGLEIGYWVHKDFTRRGIATTSSRALTDNAFDRPGVDRVEIHHDRANVASRGIPSALGYSLVGVETHDPMTPQQSGVHLIWRVTRDEWTARTGP